MNKKDIETLERIAKRIDLTLDITDLYLQYQDFLDLNEIIIKSKNKKPERNLKKLEETIAPFAKKKLKIIKNQDEWKMGRK